MCGTAEKLHEHWDLLFAEPTPGLDSLFIYMKRNTIATVVRTASPIIKTRSRFKNYILTDKIMK